MVTYLLRVNRWYDRLPNDPRFMLFILMVWPLIIGIHLAVHFHAFKTAMILMMALLGLGAVRVWWIHR